MKAKLVHEQLNMHVAPNVAARFRKLALDAGIPHRELLAQALDAYAANPPAIAAKQPKPEKANGGGSGGWGKYTSEERSAIMKARWAKRREQTKEQAAQTAAELRAMLSIQQAEATNGIRMIEEPARKSLISRLFGL